MLLKFYSILSVYGQFCLFLSYIEKKFHEIGCAKFRGSCATMGVVGLVLSWHRAFVCEGFFLVSISWVHSFFSWVFRGSEIFFRGYFVGTKFYAATSWIYK